MLHSFWNVYHPEGNFPGNNQLINSPKSYNLFMESMDTKGLRNNRNYGWYYICFLHIAAFPNICRGKQFGRHCIFFHLCWAVQHTARPGLYSAGLTPMIIYQTWFLQSTQSDNNAGCMQWNITAKLWTSESWQSGCWVVCALCQIITALD